MMGAMGFGKAMGKLIKRCLGKLFPFPRDMVQVRFRVDAMPPLITPDCPEGTDIGWYCDQWRGGHVGPESPRGIFTFWGDPENENGDPEVQVLYHRNLINLKGVTRFFNQAGFSLTLFSQRGEDFPPDQFKFAQEKLLAVLKSEEGAGDVGKLPDNST